MIDPSRTVALVGRPNVGKSRLFNRLCGRRLSIVHDQPGVTRDVVAADVDDDYRLLDTGGIGLEPEMTPERIARATEEQVDFAIQAASLLLFIVDAIDGVTSLDAIAAEKLRRHGLPVILVANKVDTVGGEAALEGECASLGLGEPILVSAEHGHGMEDLAPAIASALGPKPDSASGAGASESAERTRIALVGRPNVGKSSIGNNLLDSSRLIVSDVPGTTRDSVELDLDYPHPDGEMLRFRFVDTAGLRSKRKVDKPVEYFSGVRTQHAIERADVVFLVIDALDGVTRQDQVLAGDILDAGRALVVVVNKWDLVKERWKDEPLEGYKNLEEFLEAYEAALRKELFFLPDPPVLFVSATTGFSMPLLLDSATSVEAALDLKLPTGPLNRLLQDLIEARPPRNIGAKRFKVFYAVQVGNRPLRLRLYCNRVERLEPAYRRYLERALIKEFRLHGCPIRFDLVGKEKRYSEEEERGSGKNIERPRSEGNSPARKKQKPGGKRKTVKTKRAATKRGKKR
ncbi:MAG: ribosome biogenesis GTPase Der [Opitutales bacterium]